MSTDRPTDRISKLTERDEQILRDMFRCRNLSMEHVRSLRN